MAKRDIPDPATPHGRIALIIQDACARYYGTKAALCIALGVGHNYFDAYERGISRPGWLVLQRLGELGYSIDWIMFGGEEEFMFRLPMDVPQRMPKNCLGLATDDELMGEMAKRMAKGRADGEDEG